MLRYMVIFSVLHMTAVNVRAQCERPDVGENRILTDESNKPPFLDGSTVKFKCATGYLPARPSASRTITCSGTQWSDLELKCKGRSCGSPGEINNGKYQMRDGILFGATITAVCNEGYQLLGPKTRNCRERGWDGRAPECTVLKCEPPPHISNGTFYPEDEFYAYGEAVTYSCKGGHDLIGTSTITCSSDGKFQPPPPQCLFVSCESPQIRNATRIEGKSPPYKYRQFVRYRCNKGHRMEGSDYLICTENGWDPPPPQCPVITCPKPPDVNNTNYATLKELYEYGQTVTYSCIEGFRVTQPSTISCTDKGTFETAPQCLEITCESPSIKSAVISGSSSPYMYGNSIQISCVKDYRIEGSKSLTCGEHGWIPSLPRCIEIICEQPKVNDAAIIRGKASLYRYKMTIQYRCNKGYSMEGSDLLTCEENGWNPPPPKCNIVTCPKPPDIAHGEFTPQKEVYVYGERVTYSCREEFSPDGPSTISCTEHGMFENPPQCLAIPCESPSIENAVISGSSTPYVYGVSIQIRCVEGYQIEGSESLTCGEHGWIPSLPRCTAHQPTSTIILIIMVFGGGGIGGALVGWKKNRKSKEHKAASSPENCSLVKMPSSCPTEEAQPQRTEDPIQNEKNEQLL